MEAINAPQEHPEMLWRERLGTCARPQEDRRSPKELRCPLKRALSCQSGRHDAKMKQGQRGTLNYLCATTNVPMTCTSTGGRVGLNTGTSLYCPVDSCAAGRWLRVGLMGHVAKGRRAARVPAHGASMADVDWRAQCGGNGT